ncbi:MAG TPA: DUF4337 domain-containing protein [Pyrinomonadaceae bacterium]|jgi:hypothetical protein
MSASDAADHILEAAESAVDEKFRSRVAFAIALMAMLLAIASLGGGNAAEDMLGNNIEASDAWAFYQAKNVRQTAYRLAADELETELRVRQDSLTPEARQELQRRLDQYKETVERYESEPDPKEPGDPLKGEGKKELSARARNFQEQRDRAMRQDPNFDYSEALFQIAIVLASVAILITSRPILWLSLAMAAVAFVLMLNGFLLFFTLPF